TNVPIPQYDLDPAVSARAARHSPDHLKTSPRGTDEPRRSHRRRFLPRSRQDDLALARRREAAVQRIGSVLVLFSTRRDASTYDRAENRARQVGKVTRRGTSIDFPRIIAARFRCRRVPPPTQPKQLGCKKWRNDPPTVSATRELHHIGRALEKLLRAPLQPWQHQLRDPARYQDHPARHEIGEAAYVSGRAQGRIQRNRFLER